MRNKARLQGTLQQVTSTGTQAAAAAAVCARVCGCTLSGDGARVRSRAGGVALAVQGSFRVPPEGCGGIACGVSRTLRLQVHLLALAQVGQRHGHDDTRLHRLA